VTALVAAAAFAPFDWRYQLPQLTLIPVAAVLGIMALFPAACRGAGEGDGGVPPTRPHDEPAEAVP
jgi:hypothetical protein